MKPGKVYRLQFDTTAVPSSTGGADRVDAMTILVQIFDYGMLIPDNEQSEYFDLQPAAEPLIIDVVDNSDSKFKPIRGKQATIRFISQQDLGLDFSTFSGGYDNQYYVSIVTGGTTIFLGYLVLEDCRQPLLPDPQEVELIASDHLGLLKEVPVVDTSGDNISGKYRIAELISFCLKQTGLSLPINVINNLRMGTGSDTITNVEFSASDNTISGNFLNGFFYVGQVVVISGSAFNNGTYRVVAINTSTKITVDGVITDESATIYNVTFTDGSSQGHFYDKAYLDAKTFEQSIGESIDCYSALETILADDCTLFQYKGEWWIIRIDEYDNNDIYVARFNADGELIQEPTEKDMSFFIGFEQNVLFREASQDVSNSRPHKFITEQVDYVSPIEVICNIDFERGMFDEDLPNVVIEGTIYNAKKYSIECWDYGIHKSFGEPKEAGSGEAYIKRLFYNDQEAQRYIRIDNVTPTGIENSLKSQPVPVAKNDKFTISLSSRWSNSFDASSNITATIGLELVGDDGTYWYARPKGLAPGETSLSDLSWSKYNIASEYILPISNAVNEGADFTQWQSQSYNADALPVSGNLFIYVFESNLDVATYIEHDSINFTYIPQINGSYQRYKGHKSTVERVDTGYLAKRINTVKIGDVPRPLLKGAIFFESGSKYYLAGRFYPAAKFNFGLPASSQLRTFSWHQAFAIWNQYKSAYTIVRGTVWGLPEVWPDLIHKYTLTDPSNMLINRYFILISLSQNWRTGAWRATFVEVYNSASPKEYNTPFEFKYLTDGNN